MGELYWGSGEVYVGVYNWVSLKSIRNSDFNMFKKSLKPFYPMLLNANSLRFTLCLYCWKLVSNVVIELFICPCIAINFCIIKSLLNPYDYTLGIGL